MKKAIGVLDYNFEGIELFNQLAKSLRFEAFIYLAEEKKPSENEKEIENFKNSVECKINYLLKCEVKMLLVISDVIVEYCEEMLSELKIPVVNIVKAIIDFVNDKYEQKDLILLAKDEILKANLYQKNFKYNHLYNINSNELKKLLDENEIKTSKSFYVVKEVLKNVALRQVDLLIITESSLQKLKTEITEVLSSYQMIDLYSVIYNEIKKHENLLETKKRGTIFIAYIDKKSLLNKKIKKYNVKYKYLAYQEEVLKKEII